MSDKVKAYKGFNRDWTCRGFQYEMGNTHVFDGEVVMCWSGFHACTRPMDVFWYYHPGFSVFAEVELAGEICSELEGCDSKLASKEITVVRPLSLLQMADIAVVEIDKDLSRTNDHFGYANHTRYCGMDPFSFAFSAGAGCYVETTERQSSATVIGERSAAIAIRDQSVASSIGQQSVSMCFGNHSVATTHASSSIAVSKSLGCASLSLCSGSAAVSTNVDSVAVVMGSLSAAESHGDNSVALATRTLSAASVSGIGSVAIALGQRCVAKAEEGGSIVVAHISSYGHITAIRASLVGQNGIEPGKWYKLSACGEFVECKGVDDQ